MQLFLKSAMVFFLTLCILVPLALIGDIVRDRQAYHAQAVEGIAANYGRAQTFAGPVLALPYVETRTESVPDDKGNTTLKQTRTEKVDYVFPTRLTVDGTLPTDIRARGSHTVPVYTWQGHVAAQFNTRLAADEAGVTRVFGTPWLSYESADPRGLQGVPALKVNGQNLVVKPGAGYRDGNGIHARIQAPVAGGALNLETTLDIALRGTGSFALLPVGDDNRIDLKSDWSSPKFVGTSPDLGKGGKGFAAHWGVSALSLNTQTDYVSGKPLSQLGALPEGASVDAALPGRLTVALIDPVNAYATIARAIKYGVLFVVVTFAGFFLFEFMKGVSIHPIQYLLVGLAMAIFFLLLVSLSEHFAFGLSYLVAACACVGLVSWYLSAVLRGWRPAAGFTALLATLYAVLYGVLGSEDNALVLGSALLFVLLAAIMGATRKFDWYAVSTPISGWKGRFSGQSDPRK